MRRYAPPMARQRSSILGDHLRDDRLRAGPRERRLAGEHLIEHCAQRVHVGTRVHGAVPRGLLRGHVLRRAERKPRLRDPRPGRLFDGDRDPEVRDEGVPIL